MEVVLIFRWDGALFVPMAIAGFKFCSPNAGALFSKITMIMPTTGLKALNIGSGFLSDLQQSLTFFLKYDTCSP
jgi:hypothetical protein